MISQISQLAGYATGIPDPARSRAWTFTLDGHTFYVLDLGAEGTWAFDVITKEWTHIYTQGFNGSWNFSNGCMWGNRIVGSDLLYNTVWELVPDAVLDEGWRPIFHAVTGAIATRTTDSVGCAQLRLAGSVGQIQDPENGIELNMRFSDDNSQTWSPYFTVDVEPGNVGLSITWAGLGSFTTPGRVFEITDSGGMIRIDGADASLNNFDDDKDG